MDLNKIAKKIVDATTQDPKPEKNPAAVELGRRGGLVGGRARAEKLSKEDRRKIASDAARARWQRENQD